MNRKDKKWLILAIALYLAVGASAWALARHRTAQMQEELAYQEQRVHIAEGERDNAEESARQWKAMYDESLREIASLKAENEELTRAFEETSFALDEVVYATGWTQLGEFKLTFYCPCEKCCGRYANGLTATGTVPEAGRTIAVDPSVIPLGSRVQIDGHVYIAEDTGVRGHVIDVFVNDHDEALRLGVERSEVKVVAA